MFMVGWSPALWTIGYFIIAKGDETSDVGDSSPKHNFSWTTLVEGFKRIMNPPLCGVSTRSIKLCSSRFEKVIFVDGFGEAGSRVMVSNMAGNGMDFFIIGSACLRC